MVSKWYYEVELKSKLTVHIGLHQEDERIEGVVTRRPFLDIDIAVMQKHENGTLELVDNKQLERERQVEIELELQPGTYVILPRTSGALLLKP